MTHHLVTIIILILYTLNCLWYGVQGDFGRAGYWFFAAGITTMATWFIKY